MHLWSYLWGERGRKGGPHNYYLSNPARLHQCSFIGFEGASPTSPIIGTSIFSSVLLSFITSSVDYSLTRKRESWERYIQKGEGERRLSLAWRVPWRPKGGLYSCCPHCCSLQSPTIAMLMLQLLNNSLGWIESRHFPDNRRSTSPSFPAMLLSMGTTAELSSTGSQKPPHTRRKNLLFFGSMEVSFQLQLLLYSSFKLVGETDFHWKDSDIWHHLLRNRIFQIEESATHEGVTFFHLSYI